MITAGSHNQRLQLPKKASGLGQSQFYGKTSGGITDADVREKVAEALKACLDKVIQETKSAEELPSTEIVAAAVEQALFDLFRKSNIKRCACNTSQGC